MFIEVLSSSMVGFMHLQIVNVISTIKKHSKLSYLLKHYRR